MKSLIIIFAALLPAAALACNKKIDPNKVMLFVDTNYSDLEIATSQKAACERGERLVVVPKNYKDYAPYIGAVERAAKKAAKCGAPESAACETAKQEYGKAYQNMTKYQMSQKSLHLGVKEALDDIKKSGGKIQQFTISGHDGGGNFGGHKGGFSRFDLAQLMGDYEDINDVKSLLLLGCYTGTQFEVMEWKNIFPKTKIIGGYDGSAPLSDRPQGHQYITDILSKEQSLISQADNKKLMAFVNSNFKGLNNLNAAMYVQCSDGSSLQDYYYGSKKARKFTPMETKECLEKKAEMAQVNDTLQKYASGELEVPKDTANGELRALYNKARTYEHCTELTGVFIDINGIFNLLFYEGVKQNFADYYKKDLEDAEKLLAGFNSDSSITAAMAQLSLGEDAYKKAEAELAIIEKDPEAFLKTQEEELKSLNEKVEKMMNDPEYASVREQVQQLRINPMALNDMSIFNNQAFMRLSQAIAEVDFKTYTLAEAKKDPSQFIQSKRAMLDYLKSNVDHLSASVGALKNQKPVWVPTAENLKKYSRKELLENVHRIHKIMSLNGSTSSERKALNWISQVTQNHLQNFKNPSNWHEFTGRAETPPHPIHLKDVPEFGSFSGTGFYGINTGGFSGGFNGGIVGGMGGGYTGGFQGGSTGSSLMDEFELPSTGFGFETGIGQ